MLQGGAVEDDVDVLHRASDAVAVADVADEKAQIASPGMHLTLIELLRLVATEDANDGGVEVQQSLHEARADGAGTAGDEHPAAGKHLVGVDGFASCGGRRGPRARPPIGDPP